MESTEVTEIEIGDQQSVLLKVASLYASHLLSDIFLVVGEQKYPAHRVILSASSEVFQCMLLNPQWQESKESVIHLVEDPQSCLVFPQFLKYLYTGQVRISIETAMPLLSLADKYNIKDLIALCREFMTKNIAIAGSKGFLISWLQYTLLFISHQLLSTELKNFLRLNIEIVGYSRDFVDIDPNNLVVLLQQNDLVIKNEAKLFDIIERWLMIKREQIEHEESLSDEEKAAHMKSLIEGICSHIRFPMMTVHELAKIPLKPITAFSKEFFCDRMALGMSFHAGQPITQNVDANEANMQFTPRLYTSDVFCQEIEVEEIHNVENYKNFAACFFSLTEFPYNSPGENIDESTIQWEIDFYPRGIRYNRAQLINVFYLPMYQNQTGNVDIPETIMRTVRVRCTCKATLYEEQRFKIAVLVSGCQNNVTFFKTHHTRTTYFSNENRVVNIDNLVPYDELSADRSVYLIGKDRDTVRIHVIITPMQQGLTQDPPEFQFK